MRDELLNITEFGSLTEARILIEDWTNEYNTWRPHSSLRGLTPAEYAEHCSHRHQPTHPQRLDQLPGPRHFQQTLKKWLTAQPDAGTLDELQNQLDAFVDEYNHRRPHRSLGRTTPAATYTMLPKAGPGETDIEGHYRIRHDIVGDTGTVTLRHKGTLHHIGIGRTHARTHIIMLIDNRDIRIVDPATGELLRQLTLDPTHNYQPQNQQHKKTPKP